MPPTSTADWTASVARVAPIPAHTTTALSPEKIVILPGKTLFGQPFVAMSAGKLDPFNHAVSFMIECDGQAEIDRIWNAILKNGGQEQQCSWIRDRWGLCWQITPGVLLEMMKSPDREAGRRAAQAMMKMVKLDIAVLEKAFNGD